jgi:hypothetical protein
MFDWLKKIFGLKLNAICTPLHPYSPTTQEDPRTVETVKRTRASIKNQEVSMNMRALKSHALDCNDVWTCTADPCFKLEPDKIVSVSRASQDELTRYNKTRKRHKKVLSEIKKTPVRKS